MGQACCTDNHKPGDYDPKNKRLQRIRKQANMQVSSQKTSNLPRDNQQSRASIKNALTPKLSLAAAATERKLGDYQPFRSYSTDKGPICSPTVIDQSGNIYVGEMRDGKPYGLGKLYLVDGSYFTGTFNEMPEGQGRFITEEGIYYEGEVERGVANGKGKTVNNLKGYSYDGDWVGNIPEGEGHQNWTGVSQYKGDFKDGIKEGKGHYKRMGQYEYDGQFSKGEFNGEGRIEMVNGQTYKGSWKDGIYHGFGVYQWSDHSSYEGDFVQGLKDGKGKYKTKDGQTFEGTWERGKRNGKGKLYKDGKTVEGHWQSDKFVRLA